MHLRSEGFWTDDPPDVPTSAWYARCTAGVLHDPEGESVICLCGLDQKEWPEGLETGDGAQVSGLPRVEGPPTVAAWSVHPSVSTEQFMEESDSARLNLPNSHALRVDGLSGVTLLERFANELLAKEELEYDEIEAIFTEYGKQRVLPALDADGPVRVDNAGQIGEEGPLHNAVLTGGGEDTAPFYRDKWLEVWRGDALSVLRRLPSESVHCAITSPP